MFQGLERRFCQVNGYSKKVILELGVQSRFPVQVSWQYLGMPQIIKDDIYRAFGLKEN